MIEMTETPTAASADAPRPMFSGVAPCYVPADDLFYLSFGGGVNSTALYLYLLEHGQTFEAVYIDHGTDYPETAKFVEYFAARYPVTIINATVTRKGQVYTSLHEFCELRNLIPQQYPRWCTEDWKKDQIYKYVKKPCWMAIGIDAGESHRARDSNISRVEFVHPLVDAGIDRQGCKNLIIRHGLKVPPKSGCWICPFQRPDQWKELRRNHPALFCRAERMETASGRTFDRRGRSLKQIINERQNFITADMDYPPCNCGL
jgi:3'-phosphoadenosine 5'-phosphosulfate sulfotransferase (PAPS reductase)/FAD synthetase